MDTLIFTSDSVKGTKVEEPVTAKKDIPVLQQSANKDIVKSIAENETQEEVEVENIVRPVDLYKVTTDFHVKPFLSLILAKAYRINVCDAFFFKECL
jgi:hypothetical protein